MEEGKDKIAISCGDFLTLSQAMCSQEVKYTRLEMKFERLEDDYINVKAQLAKSEAENLELSATNRTLEETVRLLQEEIHALKAKLNDRADASTMSDQEMIQKAIVLLLKNYLLLSIEKVKEFMKTRDVNLTTASIIRGFVEDTIPDELKTKLLEVIHNVVLLPGKPEQPKFEPTINGGQAFFGNITNSEFLGKEKDSDE